MDNTLLLVVTALVVYIVMAICGLIPVCIVAKKSPSDKNFSKTTARIISFCNCMAGGVFIAMCFLGLLPYAQDKTRQVLADLHISTDFPLSEFIIIVGFFLIMTVEQLIMKCQETRRKSKILWEITPNMTETERPTRLNYYKTMKDESAMEQLLSKNSSEATSPESPSVVKEFESSPTYQNVPLSTFKEEDGSDSSSTIKTMHSEQSCANQHIEVMMSSNSSGALRLAMLFFAISIHSVFEGMALGLQTDHMRIFHLFFAIMFHEALVAFSVGITMARQDLTQRQGVKYILLFSLAVPVGIFLGLLVQQAPGTAGSMASAVCQSLAAGIFIHVTFLELLPSELSSPKDRMAKVAFHFLGFIALSLVTVAMGSHH